MIELLVVVAIIAILCGLLLPAVQKVRSAAEAAAQGKLAPAAAAPGSDGITGVRPVIERMKMDMDLTANYHQVDVVVYTRYQVDCAGRIVFRHPGGADKGPVLLFVPFPEAIVEARDVELNVIHASGPKAPIKSQIQYRREGIYCSCTLDPEQSVSAVLRFTALGRDRFDYRLPPAQQLQAIDLTLSLHGSRAITIPDNALQPTTSSPDELHWEIRNLVSDRKITVLIPEEMAPAARVFYLWRFAAVGLLIFGAGFLYLSEQDRPGQLDTFRLGQFGLLALTYSLFFALFTVLEFHADLGTVNSLLLSAAVSLPLLVFHTSGILGPRFALTRVLPLAVFSLAITVNGVYGGTMRDYAFIAAAVLIVGYITLTYPAFAARRQRHRQESDTAYATSRRALADHLTYDLGKRVGELSAAAAQADNRIRQLSSEDAYIDRARLEKAREPAVGLAKEYDELMKRMAAVPVERDWQLVFLLPALQKDADNFRERLDVCTQSLRSELESVKPAPRVVEPVAQGQTHCAACGETVPEAPYCQKCGEKQPIVLVCPRCGESRSVAVHLLPEGILAGRKLCCTHCGTRFAANLPVAPAP